jgi:type II secretory pathway component PulF
VSVAAFAYQAVDRTGRKRSGVELAPSKADALRAITSQGLTPLSLSEVREGASRRLSWKRSRISGADIAHFTYQFGVLISARIPISEGLRSIGTQERNERFREVILDIAGRIEAGDQVAQALDAHRSVFGEMYVETVRAAERSANLSNVLEMLSETLERNMETSRAVKGAMMYPMCVLSVLGIAVVFLVGFVVPKFASMFEQRGATLPIFTQVLMRVGVSVQTWWYVYLAVVVGLVFALRNAWRRPTSRVALDSLLHRVPFVNRVLIGLATSRFARILGVSLGSGLGLIESLELAGKASARPMLQIEAARLADQVRVGGRLTDVLASCRYLSAFSKRLLTAGEEAGELPRMCSVIARHYDRETSYLTKNIGTVIEPVLIVLIACVVLAVALAIFLPMWDMIKVLG